MFGGIFEENKIKDKIQTFDHKITQEDFWKDKSSAQKILKEKKFFDNIINDFDFTVSELENLEQLFELASKESDTEVSPKQTCIAYPANTPNHLPLEMIICSGAFFLWIMIISGGNEHFPEHLPDK